MTRTRTLTTTYAVLCAAALLLGLGAANPAEAAFVEEYFNDYGDEQIRLNGLNGGSGWGGNAWVWTASNGPAYSPDSELTSSLDGYENTGNLSGDTHGGVNRQKGGPGAVAARELSAPLGGTVWVSALMNGGGGNGEVHLGLASSDDSFNANGNFSNGIVLNDDNDLGEIAFDGTTSTASFSPSGTHVALAKIEIDVDGNNDKLSFWLDPDLTGGESGLGTPLLSDDGADAFGDGLKAIDVGLSGPADFDALRISNDANGFDLVTAIPEPATMALVALGGVGLLLKRRRRA